MPLWIHDAETLFQELLEYDPKGKDGIYVEHIATSVCRVNVRFATMHFCSVERRKRGKHR